MRFPLVVSLSLLLAAPVSAQSDVPVQPETPPPNAPGAPLLTMKDAIALALRHAFPSRIAGFREAAAAARVGEAWVAFAPDLSASISGNAYQVLPNQNYQVRAGDEVISVPQEDTVGSTDWEASATASYVLLSTTRRLNLAAARLQRDGLAADNEEAKRAVVRDTAGTYLRVVESDALLRLAEQDVARRTRHLAESRALVAAGKRAEFEVLRAEAELATAEAARVEAKNGARIARATLAQVVGKELPLDFATERPAPPEDPRGGKSGPDAARGIVPDSLARRPDVRAAAASAEVARIGVRTMDRRYAPTLSLFARYSRPILGTNDDPLYGDVWEFTREQYVWGGTLEIRFSDMLANRWRSKAARAESRLAAVVEDQTRVAASLEIERASLEVDRATEVSAATAKSLDAARRNYESTSERYRLGVATQTERVDAEAALVEAEVNAAKADVGYRVALWNLRYQMGETLDVP